ncbi:MAG: hypothetical protein KDH20_01325 [Rhodocyclaceae bacterium]|nr:hypothetical protein [Rhodocyclaceae bacterium]
MEWTRSVDIYCERLGSGLLAEPLNALTNLAFLVAAAQIARRHGGRLDADLRALLALLGLIGIGSGVFHTVATVWASLLDVAFIALFVVIFVHRALVRLHGWSARRAGVGVAVVIALSAALALSVRWPPLNGSELYLGPWLALGTLAAMTRPAAPRCWLWRATAVFALSVTLRSLDMVLCELWPLGTHFGWHLSNALVLWCALQALLPPARVQAS